MLNRFGTALAATVRSNGRVRQLPKELEAIWHREQMQ